MGAGASEGIVFPLAHSLALILNGASDALPPVPSKQNSIKVFVFNIVNVNVKTPLLGP